jgi:sugar lactone lactonase YvrE
MSVNQNPSRRSFVEMGGAMGVGAALGLSSEALAAEEPAPCAQREVAYVCNSYGDTISVVDVARQRVWRTIRMDFGTPRTISRWPSGQVTIANAPMNARLSRDGRQLWAPNSQGGNIAVIDVATREIVSTIDLPLGPCDIDFTPDGRQAVITLIGASTNRQGALGFIDVERGVLTSHAMIGTQPEELALTHDGKRAFAVSKSLWVYDVEANAVEAEVHLPHRCYDSLLSPDGSKLYVGALWDADKLLVIENDPDPRRIRIAHVIEANVPCCMAFTPDGSHMYVTSAAKNTIQLVDLQANRVVNTAPLPGMPSFIALTQRGDRAIVCHSGGQAVTLVDTASLRVLGSIPTGEGPSSIAMGFV